MTDSGTKCAWVIHDSKAVQNNRRCLYVPRVLGSVKNPHNNNNNNKVLFVCVEVLRPSQPSGVMSSAVSLPNHTFTGQA